MCGEWTRVERRLLSPGALGRDGVVEKQLYVWKSPEVDDEVVIGEIVRDRFGEEQRCEHLSLHMDSMLDLFGAHVYRRIAAWGRRTSRLRSRWR